MQNSPRNSVAVRLLNRIENSNRFIKHQAKFEAGKMTSPTGEMLVFGKGVLLQESFFYPMGVTTTCFLKPDAVERVRPSTESFGDGVQGVPLSTKIDPRVWKTVEYRLTTASETGLVESTIDRALLNYMLDFMGLHENSTRCLSRLNEPDIAVVDPFGLNNFEAIMSLISHMTAVAPLVLMLECIFWVMFVGLDRKIKVALISGVRKRSLHRKAIRETWREIGLQARRRSIEPTC